MIKKKFTYKLFLFIFLNYVQSYDTSMPANKNSRTINALNFLPGSRRTLGFLPGTNIVLKWLLNCPITTLTRIRASMDWTHSIRMGAGVLYPEIDDAVPIANPSSAVGRRSDVAAEHYIDNEVSDQLKFLGYGELIKNGKFKSDFHDMTESQIMETKFDQAVEYDRLRARIERTYFYSDFEALMGKMGIPGKPCMKRTICEVGGSQFEGSLFGEIFNVLLTPSLGGHPEIAGENQAFQDYIEAEKYGKSSGDCAIKYNECKTSVFSFVFDLLEDLYS